MEKTVTLEFYITESRALRAVYNGQDLEFSQFWNNIEGTQDICLRVLEAYRNRFPVQYEAVLDPADGWEETFIKLINNYFREKDARLDIMMKTSGEIVFNPEY